MQQRLEELFNKYKDKGTELAQKVQKNKEQEVWTIGLGNPFDLIPFVNETLGIKPGRIMKQKGNPSKNRSINYLDKNNRILYTKFFSSFNNVHNYWFTDEEFYEYADENVIILRYSGVEDGNILELKRVNLLEFSSGKPIKLYMLDKDGEQREKEYTYENDKIVEMTLKWINTEFPHSRKYRIDYNQDQIKIMAITKDGERQIYPPK